MAKSYISEPDRQRKETYLKWSRIFDSEHSKVFVKDLLAMSEADRKAYVIANLGALISKVSADFLFGEPIIFKTDDDKKLAELEDLRTDTLLDELLWELSLEGSYLGDAFLKARFDDSETIIEPSDPRNTRIVVEDGNPRRIKAFVIEWEIELSGQKYLRRETREKGRILNEIFRLKGEEVVGQEDIGIMGTDAPAPEVLTGVDGFLMVHIPNFRPSSLAVYGRSDFHDLETLFGAVNNRITRDRHILDKHSSPKLAVPPGVLDKEGKVRRSSFEMFEVAAHQSGMMKPEYLTWDGNLESSEKNLDRLLKFVMLISETAPDVFGLNEAGPESGRALRLRLIRTVAKIRRKKRYYNRGLQTLLYEVGQYRKANNIGTDFDDVTIEFQDGLPTDYREEAEIRDIDRRAGAVSVEQAVRERNPDWTEEQISAEVTLILDEGALAIPSQTQTMDGAE